MIHQSDDQNVGRKHNPRGNLIPFQEVMERKRVDHSEEGGEKYDEAEQDNAYTQDEPLSSE